MPRIAKIALLRPQQEIREHDQRPPLGRRRKCPEFNIKVLLGNTMNSVKSTRVQPNQILGGRAAKTAGVRQSNQSPNSG
jgi:hypothetical protein